MDAKKIKSALADVTAEQDPTLKSAKLASLCSALWLERGVELVVVGGSAIEILTECVWRPRYVSYHKSDFADC